ncbi:endoplasmic reticulum oxidoreductin 1 [Thecamonas trahens ATCC 50062]|uniref:Endoplasmic reticulum oxidoreductin 1 n=1 Tax=Thecamonas trahens ATCC 50062 TaxID=461836 RepID=A0A0L0D555_THETB|nr:endoplasmic reticulum oxidoreductin 1 [Thecamonas trahens ATCC 50062]KNC47196.1 endoplasmic reticulum oxidoreductin 1 [Thecamonas trahens ATCC 50062]|eukprot:XP_013759967.1 endoplasmic reticulum oxidoreductin 1 [Thecamonas trahens ATCC 50062]
MMEGCSLNPCSPSDVPMCLKQLEAAEEPACEPSSEMMLSLVAAVDPFGARAADAQRADAEGLPAYTPGDVWMVDDEVPREDSAAEFVDLLSNPERFTGYKGFESRSIWAAIYSENCFLDEDDDEDDEAEDLDYEDPVFGDSGHGPHAQQCLEKRVFFRLISGLHSSITCHLVDEYFFEDSQTWGPNLDMFKARFAAHPEHLDNLYFAYMLALRAFDKAAPLLSAYHYRTDNASEQAAVRITMGELVETLRGELTAARCDVPFDESRLFRGPDAAALRAAFQRKFYNISRIMDCVGCSKCRLWGKVQIRGLSVALRILFGDGSASSLAKLTRNQILTFVWTLHRLSESVAIVNRMHARHARATSLWTGVTVLVLVAAAGFATAVVRWFICRSSRARPSKLAKQD